MRLYSAGVGVDGFVVNSGGGLARGYMGRSVLLEAIALDPVVGGGRGGSNSGGGNGGDGNGIWFRGKRAVNLQSKP